MIKLKNPARATLVAFVLMAALSACQKEGPAERAGKEVDKVTESVGQQIEKAGESIQNAAEGDKK